MKGGVLMKQTVSYQNGSTLALVLIIMTVLVILGTAILNVSSSENKFAKKQENKIQAYYIARSGAQSIAEFMLKDPGTAKDFIGKTSSPNNQIAGGSFTVSVVDDLANKVVNISSVGTFAGTQQTVKIKVTRSIAGIGGLFQHAIAAKQNFTVSNPAGTGIVIEGSVASKNGTIDLGTHGYCSLPPVYDPTMIFPPIVLPPDMSPALSYNSTYAEIINSKTIPSVSGSPKYIRVGNPDGYINIRNDTIKITGNGIVHMYVNGDITLGTNSMFDVAPNAKLYVYVTGNRTVTLIGNGNQNNIFLYAPDSDISWNNAQPSNDFFGAIIGNSVTLANQLSIRFNPDMVNGVALDTTGVGVTFSGYSWIE